MGSARCGAIRQRRVIALPILFQTVFLCFSLFGISAICSVVLWKKSFAKDVKKQGIEEREYKFLRVNLETKESSRGFVTMGEDEEYHYFKSGSNHYLISKFGSDEYECAGFCSCVEKRRYASSAGVVSRGLFYLTAAVSSTLAYRSAKEYFEEECYQQLSESCFQSSIQSEVEVCEKIVDSKSELEEVKEVEDEKKKDIQIRRFFCKGNCLMKDLKGEQARKFAKEFACKDLTREGEVEFDVSSIPPSGSRNTVARGKFIKEYLTEFCKSSSMRIFRYYYPSKKKREWKKIDLCVGRKRPQDNPSVHCIQTYPEATRIGGMRYWGLRMW